MDVEVFVDQNGKPAHLAVLDERKSAETGKQHYRSVCGSPSDGMGTIKQPAKDTKTDCKDCNYQLDLLGEV